MCFEMLLSFFYFSIECDVRPTEINTQNFYNLLSNEWKKCIKKEAADTKFQKAFDKIIKSTEFHEIIQNLVDYESDAQNEIVEETKDTKITFKLQYEIIREIGAPWNWINQFISLRFPHLKSYNFRECHHLDSNDSQLIETESFTCKIPEFKGIGKTVEPEIIEKFLDYMKMRSIDTNGLIHPNYFKDRNSPSMS